MIHQSIRAPAVRGYDAETNPTPPIAATAGGDGADIRQRSLEPRRPGRPTMSTRSCVTVFWDRYTVVYAESAMATTKSPLFFTVLENTVLTKLAAVHFRHSAVMCD
jgi:hypothetical protein